jgi:hypothetical protein
MFRPLILLILATSFSWSLTAQISAQRLSMSEGVYEGLQMTVPDLDTKTVAEVWGDFTKENYDARSRYDRRSKEYQATEAEIPAIGQGDPVNLYMTAAELNNGTLVTVWIKFVDAFVSREQFPDRYIEAEKVLMRFGLDCAKEKVRLDIKQMEDELQEMRRDLDRLARDKERFEHDIEKAREAIREAEGQIEENMAAQGAKQQEIEQQLELIKAMERKLNEL